MELDSIYEEVLNYHINDYIIFEATLRKDFLEVNGILTEDGNKNFLKTIWEKILAFIKKAKVKVVEFFKNIRNKLFYNKEKVGKIWRKYYKYFDSSKADELLKDFTINNFKPFNSINYIMDLEKLFTSKPMHRLYGYGKTYKYTDNDIKELENFVNNTKEIREKIHDKIWIKDKEITQPFKEDPKLKKMISRMVLESFDELEDWCLEKEKFYKKYLEEREGEIKQEIKEYEDKNSKLNPNDYFYSSDKEFINKKIKESQNNLKALPLLDTLLFKEITIIISEFKDLFVASVKLYSAAGKYLQKKLGKDSNKEKSKEESYIDMDYINAVTEAEIYELELL